MSVELLTEHHLEFQSLKGGYIGFSESTLVKMPHCWKSHVVSHFTSYHPITKLVLKLLLAESADLWHCLESE